MNSEPQPPLDKEARRRNIIIAVVAVCISLVMYFGFIIKTAVKGP